MSFLNKTFKISKKTTDWAEYLGIKISPQQKRIDEELYKQVKENSIYALFKHENSKEEIIKRLNENEDRNIRKSALRLQRISIITSVFTGILYIVYRIFKNE